MGLAVLSFMLISALVFIGLFLLFRKYKPTTNPLKSLFYWITSIVVIPASYIGILFIWFLVSSSYEAQKFDKEIWSTNRDSRYLYVDDLIAGEQLIGLTISELENILGEADYEDKFTISFYIGYSPKTFFNMDPEWLEAKLIDGKVNNLWVRE